jgi:hypothetical protein
MSLEMVGYCFAFNERGQLLLEEKKPEIGETLWQLPTSLLKGCEKYCLNTLVVFMLTTTDLTAQYLDMRLS